MYTKAKTYKGVKVAPGSELYKALEDGDEKKAKEIFERVMQKERELYAALKR